jgi:hypothetical protein
LTVSLRLWINFAEFRLASGHVRKDGRGRLRVHPKEPRQAWLNYNVRVYSRRWATLWSVVPENVLSFSGNRQQGFRPAGIAVPIPPGLDVAQVVAFEQAINEAPWEAMNWFAYRDWCLDHDWTERAAWCEFHAAEHLTAKEYLLCPSS